MGRYSLALYLLMASLVVVATQKTKKLPHQFDFVNIDNVLNNNSLRDQLYHCVYGDGPCTSEYLKYCKRVSPEILRTNCARCTDVQKKTFLKFADWYRKHRPEEWCALIGKIVTE